MTTDFHLVTTYESENGNTPEILNETMTDFVKQIGDLYSQGFRFLEKIETQMPLKMSILVFVKRSS